MSAKKLCFFCLISVLFSCKKSSSPAASTITPPYVEPKYSIGNTIAWQDEFNYTGMPDSTKWAYDIGGDGWGNHELEYYTKNIKNTHVENGILTIEAIKERFMERNYTSARMLTKNKADWKYGRFEIRAKLPAGRGTWPAIWMLPTEKTYGTAYWPDNGEIDIMEHVGYDPNVIHATIHTKLLNFTINTQVTQILTVPTATTEFHTYALEWFPSYIKMFVDDKQYFMFSNPNSGFEKWPFNMPFHLLLNIAVGGDWGGQQGIDDAAFPQKMEIDYVRVYPLITQ